MKIRLTHIYNCPHNEFIELLQSTNSFRFVTWPLLIFEPTQGNWPERWEIGRYEFRIRLLGLLPMGTQRVNISNPTTEEVGQVVLRDNGEGSLMQRWDHWIFTQPLAENKTQYTDEIEVRARYIAPLLTPLCALFALIFYAHRQRRWRAYLAIKKR
jgi:hypothetical protein